MPSPFAIGELQAFQIISRWTTQALAVCQCKALQVLFFQTELGDIKLNFTLLFPDQTTDM